MKRNVFLILLTVPFITLSCNKNKGGFANPFEDDKYVPIGLNLSNDEAFKSSLTQAEIDSVNEYLKDSINYDKDNRKLEEHIESRDYSRAFAGIYSSGLNASNTLESINRKIVSQLENQSASPVRRKRKIFTDLNNHVIKDYSYGREEANHLYNTYFFVGVPFLTPSEKGDMIKEKTLPDEQIINGVYSETISKEDPSYLTSSKLKIISDFDEHFYIPNSYLLTIAESWSNKPYLANDDSIVLYNETNEKYGDTGIYELPNGKQFKAMQNTMFVIRLKKTSTDAKKLTEANYYVASSRLYTEIAITSEVIKSGVPITYLDNPIVVNYNESIFKYSYLLNNDDYNTDELKEVPMEEDDE